MSKFVMTQKDCSYRYTLVADDGQTILTSEGYASKANCRYGLHSARTHSQKESRYWPKQTADGKFYFYLLANNGIIMGTSQLFETVEERNRGIAVVKANTPGATVEDETE